VGWGGVGAHYGLRITATTPLHWVNQIRLSAASPDGGFEI